ncbi:BnaCnng74220D [Brassica napus]|uniref:BnaCnng74220D protein n=1 Tax=Brassica napus TaxID=3708 RepID=A0A078JYI3_BRANA|nr:BnaCnng74220D [Brassica napus]
MEFRYVVHAYFFCKHFENDGLHRKKEWDEAIEEETKKLTRKVDHHELKIRSLYSIEDSLSLLLAFKAWCTI